MNSCFSCIFFFLCHRFGILKVTDFVTKISSLQVFPQVNILHKGLLMKSLILRWFSFSFTKKTDSRFKVQTSYQRVLYLKYFSGA